MSLKNRAGDSHLMITKQSVRRQPEYQSASLILRYSSPAQHEAVRGVRCSAKWIGSRAQSFGRTVMGVPPPASVPVNAAARRRFAVGDCECRRSRWRGSWLRDGAMVASGGKRLHSPRHRGTPAEPETPIPIDTPVHSGPPCSVSLAGIARFPRVRLGHAPTPLDPASEPGPGARHPSVDQAG